MTLNIILIILLSLILLIRFISLLISYNLWNKLVDWFKRLIRYLLNPKFFLCFFIGWMITNGWCYVFIGVGSFLHIEWMRNVGLAYAALLWLPGTPEKIITFGIAILLRKILFPHDKKLKEFMAKEKSIATK